MTPTTSASSLALSLLLLAPAGAWSQQAPRPPVLSAAQVTEDALVDALAIDAPEPETQGATRGFRPAMRAAAPGAAPAKQAPGKANLLITFATGSADLTPETMQVLETVARALQSDKLAGFMFRIEGHADPRGSIDGNLRLSEERAQSVAAYLSRKLGVLPERLLAVGKGSSEPLNPDKPDAVENRRVTIVTTR